MLYYVKRHKLHVAIVFVDFLQKWQRNYKA